MDAIYPDWRMFKRLILNYSVNADLEHRFILRLNGLGVSHSSVIIRNRESEYSTFWPNEFIKKCAARRVKSFSIIPF